MLLVKTIIIYSDKDYHNYAINEEWVEVENYDWQQFIGHSDKMNKTKEIAKKLTDRLWDLETWGEEDYEHNGDFSNRGHLWEMPKDLADNWPSDKVLVGASGSWYGVSEDKVNQYKQLINVKDHEFSAFELRRFKL